MKFSRWRATRFQTPNNREGAQLDDFRNRAISDTFGTRFYQEAIGHYDCVIKQGIVQLDSVIDTHPLLDGHRIRDVGYYPN